METIKITYFYNIWYALIYLLRHKPYVGLLIPSKIPSYIFKRIVNYSLRKILHSVFRSRKEVVVNPRRVTVMVEKIATYSTFTEYETHIISFVMCRN